MLPRRDPIFGVEIADGMPIVPPVLVMQRRVP
jgi:hypothetical protein